MANIELLTLVIIQLKYIYDERSNQFFYRQKHLWITLIFLQNLNWVMFVKTLS